MRGARLTQLPMPPRLRIIPADAGSTPQPVKGDERQRDHPRRCGEHIADLQDGPDFAGSSPQMRGALEAVFVLGLVAGIIPADAGSTGSPRWRPAGGRDHPRRCGEHSGLVPYTCCHSGSSPQMRGAPWSSVKDIVSERIIPADAGSTWMKRTTR